MNFTDEFSQEFVRQAAKFVRKHPDLDARLTSLIEDLRQDPFQPRLLLLPLKGELEGVYAVRLTFAYRVTLTLLVEERTITLLQIGSRDEVYRRRK